MLFQMNSKHFILLEVHVSNLVAFFAYFGHTYVTGASGTVASAGRVFTVHVTEPWVGSLGQGQPLLPAPPHPPNTGHDLDLHT